MTGERLTEDLLKRLLAASSPEAYLEEGLTMERTFAGYLHELLEAKGLKRADVYRASGLNSTVVYDAFAGKSRLGRDNALMMVRPGLLAQRGSAALEASRCGRTVPQGASRCYHYLVP